MKVRYFCVQCGGEICFRCGGKGWLGEPLLRLRRKEELAESVAKILVQKKIAEVGEEAWAEKAATGNLAVAQFTEIEIWLASGPISYQFMSISDEVIDALATMAGIEMPPILVSTDQPDLKVVRFDEG